MVSFQIFGMPMAIRLLFIWRAAQLVLSENNGTHPSLSSVVSITVLSPTSTGGNHAEPQIVHTEKSDTGGFDTPTPAPPAPPASSSPPTTHTNTPVSPPPPVSPTAPILPVSPISPTPPPISLITPISSPTGTDSTTTTSTSDTTSYTPTPPPIVLNGTLTFLPSVVGPSSSMVYVGAGKTLAPGSTITLGTGILAQTVILQTSKGITNLVVDGSTSALPTEPAPTLGIGNAGPIPTPINTRQVIDVNGKHITANIKSQFVIGSQTLSVGSSITIGKGFSTTILLLSKDSAEHTVVVVGSKTSTITGDSNTKTSTWYTPASTTKSSATMTMNTSVRGVGDYVESGLGGGSISVLGGGLIGSATGTAATGTSTAKGKVLSGASKGGVEVSRWLAVFLGFVGIYPF